MGYLWRYYISNGCLNTGGVVFADCAFKAIGRVIGFYQDDNLTAQDVSVWMATKDDDYDKDNPDVLMVY